MRPFLKLILLTSAITFYTGAGAQISDSLYKALSVEIKPARQKYLSDKEKRTLLENARSLPRKYLNELTVLAKQLIKTTESISDQEEKILNMQRVAGFYVDLKQFAGPETAGNEENETNALTYYQKVIEYADKTSGYEHYVSDAYRCIGIVYFRKNMYDSAAVFCNKDLDISRQQKDSAWLFDGYCLLADIYKVMGLFDKAFYVNDQALKISGKKWGDRYQNRYFFKMGCYLDLYIQTEVENYWNSAINIGNDFFNHIDKSISDLTWRLYFRLAALYYRKDNYQLALKYVDSSLLEKYRSLDTYDKNTWYQYFWRSIYLVRLGQPQKALALLDSLPGTSYNNRRLIYQALYKEAAAAKDWKMAFTWHKEYIRNLDSILVTAKVTKVSGLLFEAEQKHTAAEKQIRITALENKNLIKERQQSKFISAAIGTGLLLLLAIAILMGMYRYTQVKRHSEKQLLTAELYRMESVIHDERQLQLEALSSQRKKIAENMHDEVSSGLAAFRFYIVDLKARAENKETTAILTELEAEAQVLYQQARDFMKNLNANIPSARYNVCELADQLSVRFANEKLLVIKNNIDRNGVEQYFTGSVHYELYLVIKEAVANSIKHAGASLVEIGIWFKDHTCFFSIGDNGKGFNTETAGTDGLGLKSIANRIQTINGDLKIRSAGSGTLIEGFFPV